MRWQALWSAFAPWAGLWLGAAAWFAHNQVSGAVYWKCDLNGVLLTGGTGLLAAAVTAWAGWVSWMARPVPAPPESTDRPEGRTFAGLVCAGAAALFLFAIVLQGLSGFFVPGCRP